MRRKPKPIKVELPPATLFLEDLQAIESILKENNYSCQIDTEIFEQVDINLESHILEIIKNGGSKKINFLSFRTTGDKPEIKINFEPYNAYICSSESDIISRGIISQVKEYIFGKSFLLSRILISRNYVALMTTLSLLFIIFSLSLIVIKLFNNSTFFQLIAFAIFGTVTLLIPLGCLISILFFYKLARKSYSTIFLESRAETSYRISFQNIISIVPILIAFVTLIATVSVPEIRRFLGLD